jgi:phosphoserine aminotransferase
MFKERIYNFSAGPSMLPLSVLEQARRNDVHVSGMSAGNEHRSKRTVDF